MFSRKFNKQSRFGALREKTLCWLWHYSNITLNTHTHTHTSPLALRTLSLGTKLHLFTDKYLAQLYELYIFLTHKSFSANAVEFIDTAPSESGGILAFLDFRAFGKGKGKGFLLVSAHAATGQLGSR